MRAIWHCGKFFLSEHVYTIGIVWNLRNEYAEYIRNDNRNHNDVFLYETLSLIWIGCGARLCLHSEWHHTSTWSQCQTCGGTRYISLKIEDIFIHVMWCDVCVCIHVCSCRCADCSDCPPGTFTSQNCTLSSDRECSACSSCPTGYFADITCSQYQDTFCQCTSVCPLFCPRNRVVWCHLCLSPLVSACCLYMQHVPIALWERISPLLAVPLQTLCAVLARCALICSMSRVRVPLDWTLCVAPAKSVSSQTVSLSQIVPTVITTLGSCRIVAWIAMAIMYVYAQYLSSYWMHLTVRFLF